MSGVRTSIDKVFHPQHAYTPNHSKKYTRIYIRGVWHQFRLLAFGFYVQLFKTPLFLFFFFQFFIRYKYILTYFQQKTK